MQERQIYRSTPEGLKSSPMYVVDFDAARIGDVLAWIADQNFEAAFLPSGELSCNRNNWAFSHNGSPCPNQPDPSKKGMIGVVLFDQNRAAELEQLLA